MSSDDLRAWDIFGDIESVPAEMAGLSTPRGGVGNAPAEDLAARCIDVTLGKSVCILNNDDSYKDLCCAKVGSSSNVVCFEPKNSCTTHTHVVQRKKEETPMFPAGIYVRATVRGGKGCLVHPDVVAPLSLLEHHRVAILGCEESSLARWPTLFDQWSRTTSASDNNRLQNIKYLARHQQTPAKRIAKLDMDPLDDLLTSDELDIPDLADKARTLQANWDKLVALSLSEDEVMPSPQDSAFLSQFLLSQHSALKKIAGVVEQVTNEVGMSKTWVDSVSEAFGARIGDLEVSLGDPPRDWNVGSTVWSSLASLLESSKDVITRSEFDEIKASVESHEEEFNRMFSGFALFRGKIDSSLRTLSLRMDAFESDGGLSSAPKAPLQPSNELLEALLNRLEVLEEHRELSEKRIESLENQLMSETASYEIAPGVVFRNSSDIKVYLRKIQATDMDFGGFVDVYSLLIRIQAAVQGAGTISDFVKKRKDAKSINLSEDEALVLFSFQASVPPLFGGTKSDKSDIELLQKYSDWRDKGTQSGLGYEIDSRLTSITSAVRSIISLKYRKFPELRILAERILTTAVSFVTSFVVWIDASYDLMVAGGNTSADVWNLTSKVMRAVFDEGLGPCRVTPTGTSFEDGLEQTAVMLWGVIRTHVSTEDMNTKDLKDLPIVTGNYAKWLVNHSGKKDANELKKEVDKLLKSIGDFKSTYATQKALNAVEKIADQAKKTADKAFNKKA